MYVYFLFYRTSSHSRDIAAKWRKDKDRKKNRDFVRYTMYNQLCKMVFAVLLPLSFTWSSIRKEMKKFNWSDLCQSELCQEFLWQNQTKQTASFSTQCRSWTLSFNCKVGIWTVCSFVFKKMNCKNIYKQVCLVVFSLFKTYIFFSHDCNFLWSVFRCATCTLPSCYGKLCS